MLLLGLAMLPSQGVAKEPTASTPAAAHSLDGVVQQLTQGSFALVDGSGRVLGTRRKGEGPIEQIAEAEITATLREARLTAEHAAILWDVFADQDNAPMLTNAIVEALVKASDTPKAREALWSELAGLSRAMGASKERQRTRGQSLLGYFERRRDVLRPLLGLVRETEASGDAVIELMLKTRIFGDDLTDAVAYVSERMPAVVARHIERERGLGRQARWEYEAFTSMMRWKDARLVAGAAKAPGSLGELDEAGEAFVTIFNCLHGHDEGYREVILRGLGPVEVFNAVVAGEKELYRLGTSGYRQFLHAIIMAGITQAGSFERFLARAAPRQLGEEAVRASAHRGMVFLRVLSSFGLLEPVLVTVRDRDGFLAQVIASLEDPRSMDANVSVVMDVLTAQSNAPVTLAFKRALLDRLYEGYRAERSTSMKNAYGSMLSVYQTITGDRRDAAIDREFALDKAMFETPFERLFSRDENGGLVHTMFMRMDEDGDAIETYATFGKFMARLGAYVRSERYFDVFRLTAPGRTIELYANKPRALDRKQAMAAIAAALKGRRVETVIGRGHTSIITPLQADAKFVLGDRIKDVSTVIVGSCGGDASVRELIATFGYIPFVTTKSTGRQVINNAIIARFFAALKSLAEGDRLSAADVLAHATQTFTRPGVDEALRDDAALYQVNMTTVLTTHLFELHVRRPSKPGVHAAGDRAILE